MKCHYEENSPQRIYQTPLTAGEKQMQNEGGVKIHIQTETPIQTGGLLCFIVNSLDQETLVIAC